LTEEKIQHKQRLTSILSVPYCTQQFHLNLDFDGKPSVAVIIVEPKIATFDTKLLLQSGRILGPITLAYETYGTLAADRSNAILVTHAWTGSAHLAGKHSEEGQGVGWWNPLVGPGKLLDTDRYFIICSNVIGSCHGTTGPTSLNPKTRKRFNLDFPVVTIRDMVSAQRLLIDHLGISRLLTVLGGSMGGMQALEWATQYPDRIASAVIMAATPHPSAQAIAFNSIARWAITNDHSWRGGKYKQNPKKGLSLARGIGHITFLCDEYMNDKFGRGFSSHTGLFDFFGQFDIESYLRNQGKNFSERFDANSFLYLAKAIDLYDVAWECDSLEEAFTSVTAPLQFFAFTSDWLYPPRETEEMVTALQNIGKPVEYHLITSTFGHDAFLLEYKTFTPMVRSFIQQAEERCRSS
jgi:homoserine O-acetyltransferase